MPLAVSVIAGLVGLFVASAWRQSFRGRHYFWEFFAVMIVGLNLGWFPNAGSTGRVPVIFFLKIIYPRLMFQGP